MKPLLFCALPRPPHPCRDGLAIRNYHLLASLAEEFRVRAFSLLDPDRAYGRGEIPAGVEIEWVAQRRRSTRRPLAVAASLLTRRAYSEWLYRSPELALRLRAAAAAEPPRYVLANSYHVAPAALSAGAPVWIDFHNLDSEIWRRTGETAPSAAARVFARLQAARVEAVERRLLALAAGVSCVSRRDASTLARLGAASPPLVVPNGVDLFRYEFRRNQPAEEIVFFVGDLSWPPNAEGVRWFARAVWPLILRARASARAEILGRSAPANLQRLSTSNFVLLGEGGDTRQHWARSSVAVVPLLSGGGTRLKILEAAACGVPVVSTPVGTEGLELEPGREIRVAGDTADFAAAVVGLLADPEAAARQAAAARARVEALYDWKRIGREFALALARAEHP